MAALINEYPCRGGVYFILVAYKPIRNIVRVLARRAIE